ncbi:Rv3654c family TadE-like protein [Streptomyces hawaiiensis]|uniref:Rv3654c family TadE-like protein n=1 Tax=Streptomyces hawaiiensis TaxID=67305 RepID=UPI003648BA59
MRRHRRKAGSGRAPAAVRSAGSDRGSAGVWSVGSDRVSARVWSVGSDRGSASVWSVGAIAVLCVVFGVVLALGQAVVIRHRAAGGADLAALAAADHWADGGTAACARAGRVARAQGVRLVRCQVAGEISDVTAASGRGPFTAEVRARAGPATAPPDLTAAARAPGPPAPSPPEPPPGAP